MKVFSPFLNGDTTTSGSFNVPNHPSTASIPNPLTGSLFHDDTDGILKIYTGTQWKVVGEQVTFIPPASADIEYLLIAGGGGGGGGTSGGGGAGGYLSSSLDAVLSGSSFTVTVGAGAASTGVVTSGVVGNDGDDSSIAGTTITTITATGGGGGGDRDTSTAGKPGGSGGGGGGQDNNVPANAGGSGTNGQGNDGGNGRGGGSDSAGGGGGGASAAGIDSPSNGLGGNGGNGLPSLITGTSITRAGGGGGGSHTGQSSGGTGGGGAGATVSSTNSVAGTTNTGGGGGGAGGGSPRLGAAGGSGVAIFAYDSGSIGAGGGITGDASNGRKYHQFNTGGTFKVGSTSDFQIHTTNLVMHVDAGNFASRNGNTSGIDLSTYNNNLNLGGQSGGSLTSNPWWNCDGTGGLADFERNGGSTASNIAHTGYGNMTGASTNAWTIEFWIKTTATGGNAILGKTIIGTNSGDVWATISIKSNKFNYSHADNGGTWVHTPATTDINDGNWHHCVLVNFSNETCNMFVDGTKEVSASDSGLDSGRYMKMDSLGRGYNSENTAMDIGQIRVYDASLTDAQVLQNYEATKTNFV